MCELAQCVTQVLEMTSVDYLDSLTGYNVWQKVQMSGWELGHPSAGVPHGRVTPPVVPTAEVPPPSVLQTRVHLAGLPSAGVPPASVPPAGVPVPPAKCTFS